MLNKEEFIALIKNPLEVTKEDISSLSSIIELYPYCLSARLLEIRGLKNIASINYADNLRKTAAYAPNREILYHLLMQENLQEKIEASEEEINTEKINKPDQKTIPEPVEVEIVEEKNISALEKQILEEAVHASIVYELNPTEKEANVIESNIQETETKTIDTNQKTSFTSWLKQLKEVSSTTIQQPKSNQVEKLIENFITTEPRIGETKKEFFSPENIARMSLVEDPDFVTETLAKIYAQQGNISKAILAFNKLSLKYPEKSTYFAALIKDLEEQLKQK